MKPKEIEVFEWAKHVSGVPYVRSLCCESRINRQSNLTRLTKPEVYGVQLPKNEQTIVTHVADYSCKCGKTKMRVEGSMRTLLVAGCIAWEKPAAPPVVEP